jgi:putative colanic acid biosynthesis UDP-glucose lipid carrier transferase
MFNLWEPPLSSWSVVVKAAEDRILATLILLLALPTLLTIAAVVKLDSSGPVLFRQRRFGFKNDVFTVLKFRSMAADADRDGTVPQATRGDPRVTRLGAFLRRHSLDELPQFLNVIKGDMSIVGPRPHAVAHNEQYAGLIDDYLARHKVKPGITGWAQVNGLRGETDTIEKMEARVQHDLYYVDNWSLLFDLRIILLTLFVGFRSDQAY